jgi:hypothetical protein
MHEKVKEFVYNENRKSNGSGQREVIVRKGGE